MGLSNLQVAAALLGYGMVWCDGVVFLDEYDRKMILVRATGRVVKLETSGVPAERRFAFYDQVFVSKHGFLCIVIKTTFRIGKNNTRIFITQVHTTGMDIKHHDSAVAALTLGKDMVFRDLAQGAFRMRGIAKGQRIHVLLIPEVEDLVARELEQAGLPRPPTRVMIEGEAPNDARTRRVLVACVAWLTINSMRAERVQFNQLCVQNVTNVFRKVAFREIASADAANGRGRRLRALRDMTAFLPKLKNEKLLAAGEKGAAAGKAGVDGGAAVKAAPKAAVDAAASGADGGAAGGAAAAAEPKSAEDIAAEERTAAEEGATELDDDDELTLPAGTVVTAVRVDVDGRLAGFRLGGGGFDMAALVAGSTGSAPADGADAGGAFPPPPPPPSGDKSGAAGGALPPTGFLQFWWQTPTTEGAMRYCPLRDAGGTPCWAIDDAGPPLALVSADDGADAATEGSVGAAETAVSSTGAALVQRARRRAGANAASLVQTRAALAVFMEGIGFAIASDVPDPIPLVDLLEARVDEARAFVRDAEDRALVSAWLDAMRAMPTAAEECELSREMVQEMEEEREKEQEQEQEREIEIEKYVDLAYRRDGEVPKPWPLERLRARTTSPHIYALSQFKLHKRRGLEFPPYIALSDNYFDREWVGERRLKNVCVIAEWLPDASALAPAYVTMPAGSPQGKELDASIETAVRVSHTTTCCFSSFFHACRSAAHRRRRLSLSISLLTVRRQRVMVSHAIVCCPSHNARLAARSCSTWTTRATSRRTS